ncbi:hypothetical protein [Synechococcus sp. MU1611]|uniref:hypothetical protein n=1 Tax=Synechococcus sp. MU1611 TaxID=2508345 RepID=UPI001CF886E7|nr:hypothetical protein [Synechococcus sp. MU1611]MCB4412048.1 hypothetical protein [Synechococcus sp. MU1611]
MSLIQQLHQEEKDKNYQKFCEIADEILCGDEFIGSPVLMRQIQARRDFYLDQLFNQRSRSIKTCHIVEKIDSDSREVLKKCCPGFKSLIDLQGNENNLASTHQSASTYIQYKLIDAIITKRKELRLSWDNDYKKDGQDIYCFQVLLETGFRVTPLRRKTSQKFTEGYMDYLLELDNEFMPILIVCFDEVASIVDSVKCIPFPSALRGAYHYSELVDCCNVFSGISAIDEFTKNFIEAGEVQEIQEILISPENYDMGLVYSNEDFRRWINIVHGINIVQKISDDDKNVLFLPENSYPTISLIVNGFTTSLTNESCDSANILIVDDSDYEPLYKLSAKTPKNANDQEYVHKIVLPFIHNQTKKFQTDTVLALLQSANHAHLALHPPRSPISNFENDNPPTELENPEILVIVNVTEASSVTEEFLLSLVFQQNIHISRFIFLVNPDDEEKLKVIYKTLAAKWNWKIKYSFNGDVDYLQLVIRKTPNILFVNQYIILQDPNTLRILADDLKKYHSFSTGCLLSHLQSAQKHQLYFNNSAGLYLSLSSYSETGRIVLQARNIIKTLPPTEICVLSNHFDLGLYDSKLLLSNKLEHHHLTNIEQFLVQASCEAPLKGFHNVCTTKVCANYLRSPTLNMSLTLDAETSLNVITNLAPLLNKVTSFSNLLP